MATSRKKSAANTQAFLAGGGTQAQLGGEKYGKRMNAGELKRLLAKYAGGGVAAAPSAAPPSAPALPAPVNPAYSNYSSSPQLEALQQQYTGSLTPVAGETEADTQLQNIITSKELGVAKAEQEPMAQGFVTGQSAALEKSAALKALPLQTKLANLQSQRQSAADVLKASLGFETGRLGSQRSAYEFQESLAEQQREFGANLSFDKLKYSKELGTSKKQKKAERKKWLESIRQWEEEQKDKGANRRIQEYQFDTAQELREKEAAKRRPGG